MKLLIFDIDGTLTNTNQVDNESFVATFEERYAVKLGKVDWKNFQNVTDSALFHDIYFSVFEESPSQAEMEAFRWDFLKRFEVNFKTNPALFQEVKGAANFLKHCESIRNIRVALATGSWRHSAIFKLMTADIPYQWLILSHCDSFFRRQDILRDAIAQCKEKYAFDFFEHIVYFGDGEWDFRTTAELEIPFIGIDVKKDNKLKNLGTQHVFYDFLEVEAILEAVEQLNVPEKKFY